MVRHDRSSEKESSYRRSPTSLPSPCGNRFREIGHRSGDPVSSGRFPTGMGGRFPLESPAGFVRNTQQAPPGSQIKMQDSALPRGNPGTSDSLPVLAKTLPAPIAATVAVDRIRNSRREQLDCITDFPISPRNLVSSCWHSVPCAPLFCFCRNRSYGRKRNSGEFTRPHTMSSIRSRQDASNLRVGASGSLACCSTLILMRAD